jgi:hypothetical protein
MPHETSAAGPFKFRLSRFVSGQLGVDETAVADTSQIDAGPRNKTGGLKKFYGRRGGFDFVQVVNSTDEILAADADGTAAQDVPPATSVNISGVGPEVEAEGQVVSYTRVAVTNTGIANGVAIDPQEIAVAFGNQPRPEESRKQGLALDVVDPLPGVVRRGD